MGKAFPYLLTFQGTQETIPSLIPGLHLQIRALYMFGARREVNSLLRYSISIQAAQGRGCIIEL